MSTINVDVKTGAEGLKELLGLLKGTMQQNRPEPGCEPAHDDPSCNCVDCRLSRYEMPLPLEGEQLAFATRNLLKDAITLGERSGDSLNKEIAKLILAQTTSEIERAVLQCRIDRLDAAVRLQHALNAMLPEDMRAPADALSPTCTIEQALEALTKSRAGTSEKMARRRAQMDVARMAVDSARETMSDRRGQ